MYYSGGSGGMESMEQQVDEEVSFNLRGGRQSPAQPAMEEEWTDARAEPADVSSADTEESNFAKPVVMPFKYDGTGDLDDYLEHFELCATVNGWTPGQAGAFLGVSLGSSKCKFI